MHWLIRPWRHMFDFRGRATRREYWLFHLQAFAMICAFTLVAVGPQALLRSEILGALLALPELAVLFLIVVAVASVAIRRLHDHDKSGWFLLLALFPLFGWIYFLIMMLTPGTDGENSYGYDPRYGDEPPAEDVAAVFS